MSFDFVDYKKDFPLLMQQDVAYLDSAATAQRRPAFCRQRKNFTSRPTPTPCAACMNWAWRRLTVTRPPRAGTQVPECTQ